MATQLGVLEYLISARDDTQRGINSAERKTKKFGDKLSAWTIAKGQLIGKFAESTIRKTAEMTKSLISSAIKSYADYEQLVGGIETLFGESQNKVMNYAKMAYKTAGVSANQYMELTTSFAASLLQSVGEDTAQAADLADRAITDMADNANKMGTDLESIQNAYKGFSKQNYTMLDNLKLGYGGTKSEMKRLIDDAAKLTDVQKELGIEVKKNDMSFGNIVKAISVIQKKRGIMGTTAEEAEKTIWGSIGMLKAAWANLLIAIGDKDGDVQGSVNKLFASLKVVAKNLLPVFKTVIKNILAFAKEAFKNVSKFFDLFIDELKKSDNPIFQTIGKGLEKIKGLVEIVIGLFTDFPATIQKLRESGDPFSNFAADVLEGVQTVLQWIIDNKDVVVPAIEAIIAAFAVGQIAAFVASLNPVVLILGAIAGAATLIATNWAAIKLWFEESVIKPLIKGFNDWWAAIQQLWSDVKGNIEAAWSTISGWFNDNVIAPISGFFTDLWNTISQIWTGISDKVTTAWNLVKRVLEPIIEPIKSLFTGLWDSIKQIWTDITTFISDAWSQVEGVLSPILQPIKSLFEGVASAAQSIWDKVNEIFKFGSHTIDITLRFFSTKGTFKAAGLSDSAAEGMSNVVDSQGIEGAQNSPALKDILPYLFNAKGNWNVPYDNYPALLHRGEMVLNKSQARQFRDGESGMDASTIGSMIGSAMKGAMSKVYIMMSGEKVADLTTKRLNRNINAITNSRLRALGG